MRKGEQTHQAIIEQVVGVFNQHGYAGTSMSDVMEVTGLSKGAIYNHFQSKDDLAVQVFDYAFQRVQEVLNKAVRQAPKHAIERLLAGLRVYENYTDNPLLQGGCPILNTSVEADDTHPVLRAHVQQAVNTWHRFVVTTIQRGIQEGQVRPDVDPDAVASLIIAGVEGGIMVSKLYGDSSHINRVIQHLEDYLINEVQA